MEILDKYLANLDEYDSLEEKDKLADPLVHLEKVSQAKRRIKAENDAIIAEIKKYNDITLITDDIKEELSAFANKLSSPEGEIDTALSFEVHKILLNYAKAIQDEESIIEEAFQCGITEFIISNGHVDVENKFFEEVLTHENHYLNFNSRIKEFVLKSYGNEVLVKYHDDHDVFIQKNKKTLEKYREIEESDKNSDVNFPLLNLITYRNIVAGFSEMIQESNISKEVIDLAYDASKKSFELAQKLFANRPHIYTSYYLFDYILKFYHHDWSRKDLLEALDVLSKEKEELSPLENITNVFKASAYYILFLSDDESKTKDDISLLTSKKIEYVKNFSNKLYGTIDPRIIDNLILTFISIISRLVSYEDIKDVIFEITVNRHKPTYIHTLTMKDISLTILDYMLDHNPEYFVGIFDNFSLERIKSSKKEIMDKMDEMGRLHDVGKYTCMQYIQNSSRRLHDLEFKMIKYHPEEGVKLFAGKVPSYVHDAILFHQLWFNNKGGYPLGYTMTNNKPLVDILSVADSIDAGTDYRGRPYSKIKTLDDLIMEFNSFLDTRYSKVVVEALYHKEVYDKVQEIITTRRDELIAKYYFAQE